MFFFFLLPTVSEGSCLESPYSCFLCTGLKFIRLLPEAWGAFPQIACAHPPGLQISTLDVFNSVSLFVWIPVRSNGLQETSVTSPTGFPFLALCSTCPCPKALCTLSYMCLPRSVVLSPSAALLLIHLILITCDNWQATVSSILGRLAAHVEDSCEIPAN